MDSIQGKYEQKSFFSGLFIIQNGIISVSLHYMTIFGCLSITTVLLIMLFRTCSLELEECSWSHFPMISDVIRQSFYDKVFLVFTTFYSFAVQQVNYRAYYKRLWNHVDPRLNDFMLLIGIVSCLTLPLISIFDDINFSTAHLILAFLFFGSVQLYSFILQIVMTQNRSKFCEHG